MLRVRIVRDLTEDEHQRWALLHPLTPRRHTVPIVRSAHGIGQGIAAHASQPDLRERYHLDSSWRVRIATPMLEKQGDTEYSDRPLARADAD